MQKIICICLFLAFANLLCSQVIRKEIPDIINASNIIFEGQVIRSDAYWNQNEDYIYTSHTIEISKIFKGDIICGTIEIITKGGRVGDTELTVSHNLTLLTGEVGLFFCNPVALFELPTIDYYPETNTGAMEVMYSEQGFFKYYNDEINHAIQNPFYNLDSLAQAYDVLELYTQLSYIDCNPTIVGNYGKPNIFTQRKVRENIREEILKNTSPHWDVPQRLLEHMQNYRKNELSSVNGTGDTIVFDFQNIMATGNNQFVEFDIVVRANDNTTYLEGLGVRLIYDNAVFGNNILANNKVTVTRGTLIQSLADYDNPLLSDFNATTFSTYIYTTIGVQNRVLVTTFFQQLIHIKIEVADCHKEALLYFSPLAMLPYCSYAITPNAPTGFFYSKLKASNIASNMLCLPQITNIQPPVLHGGMGEMLTITGTNFGAIQGNGKVVLQNANDGGASFSPLDNADIISWSNTQIQCIIPSIVDGATIQGSPYKGLPGSGEVVVMNNAEELSMGYTSLPTAYLNIVYSLMNQKDVFGTKREVALVNSFGSGGYEFFPNTALQNDAQVFAVVKTAANAWRCYSHINYKINNTPTATTSTKDGKNTIRLGNTSSSSVMAETSAWRDYCNTDNSYSEPEIDIIINNSVVFWYDTASTSTAPFGTIDLYQLLLHEMGHGNLLNHVNDSLQVMWWTSFSPITHRATNLFNDFSTVGAFDVMTNSNTPLGCGVITHIPSTYCWGTNPIETSETFTDVKLYPNPTINNLTIKIEKPDIGYNGVIRNMLGQRLTVFNISDTQTEIDFSIYPNGVYLVSIASDSKIFTTKIIKQ